MVDRASGDSCTVGIDHRELEITLFAQKPEAEDGVQGGTHDWFHHMPRVGAGRLGEYTVQVSVFPTRNLKQESVHVLTITILDGRGEKYAAVGASALQTQSGISMTKTLDKANGESLSASCLIGSSQVEHPPGTMP